MTDEQIENWRKILAYQIGPYAYLMPKEVIEALRDTIQEAISQERAPKGAAE